MTFTAHVPDEQECRAYLHCHSCWLINCPKDDPHHVHVCFADDMDWTEGDHVLYNMGRIDYQELRRRSQPIYMARRNHGLNAQAARDQSRNRPGRGSIG